MGEWANERTKERTNEWTEFKEGQMDRRTDGLMDGSGWINKWVKESRKKQHENLPQCCQCCWRAIRFLLGLRQYQRPLQRTNTFLDNFGLSWFEVSSLRVDFHCREIFTCVRVKITCVNRMEAIYERSRVNLKVETCSSLLLRATSNTLPPFYLRG